MRNRKIGNKTIRNSQLNKRQVKIPNIWISGKDCACTSATELLFIDQRIWYNQQVSSLLTETQLFFITIEGLFIKNMGY